MVKIKCPPLPGFVGLSESLTVGECESKCVVSTSLSSQKRVCPTLCFSISSNLLILRFL